MAFAYDFGSEKSLGFLARKADSFICNGLRFLSFLNILFFIIELIIELFFIIELIQINIFVFYYLY